MLKLGRPKDAIQDYSRALELTPGYYIAQYGRGLAYRMQNDKAAADRDIGAATKINPNVGATYRIYGLRTP